MIQSPTTLPENLDIQVSLFLEQFEDNISQLTEESLRSHKEGISNSLTATGSNLTEVSEDYWVDIDGRYPEFNQSILLAEANSECHT